MHPEDRYVFEQEQNPKYLLKIQPTDGIFYTNSNDPSPAYDSEIDSWGMNKGINASFNYGYSSFIPDVYLILEYGNAKSRSPVSGIFILGATKNLIINSVVGYVRTGPSFNFEARFEKVNLSLDPYVEYYNTSDYLTYDTRYPGNTFKIPYT